MYPFNSFYHHYMQQHAMMSYHFQKLHYNIDCGTSYHHPFNSPQMPVAKECSSCSSYSSSPCSSCETSETSSSDYREEQYNDDEEYNEECDFEDEECDDYEGS